MNSALKQKLRNWLVIFTAVFLVDFVVQVVARILKIEINSSGPAIAAGLSIWFVLEGGAKIKKMTQKQGKKDDDGKWD